MKYLKLFESFVNSGSLQSYLYDYMMNGDLKYGGKFVIDIDSTPNEWIFRLGDESVRHGAPGYSKSVVKMQNGFITFDKDGKYTGCDGVPPAFTRSEEDKKEDSKTISIISDAINKLKDETK